jgi:hypothetical protein
MSSPAQPPAPQPQYCTSHFVTGEYQPVVAFLDEVAYAQCLDTLVKACNDMLLTRPDGKVFLGKRQVFVRPEHARVSRVSAFRACRKRHADFLRSPFAFLTAGSPRKTGGMALEVV